MSMHSRAIRVRLSGLWNSSVRMLCSLSASLIRITRTSRTIANNILRIDSAARAQWLCPLMMEILVTPWTRPATSAPNAAVISSRVEPVSSTTSWSSAAITVSASRRVSTRMAATSSG